MDKETQMTNWFTVEKPVFPVKKMIYFLITWVVVLLIAFLIIKMNILIKVALFAGIGVWAYFKYIHPFNKAMALFNSRPSDAQMDEWFEEAMNKVITKVIKKEGIDEEDEDELKAPIFISCFPWNGYNRFGFDNKERVAVWRMQLVFFKEDNILYYDGQYGHISEEISHEETHRVFYKDIISPKVMKDEGASRLILTGTEIEILHYPGAFPVHGKNRTSDIDFLLRALEKMMQSTKYKTISG
jgi:hypothetical protein